MLNRVAVVGAGITGITTAYLLAKKGADVTVFEANAYPAMETSYANGGQLSASNAEVWNSYPTVLKGLRWMFSAGAPLLMNPKPSWHKYSWLAEFIAAIRHYEKNTISTAKLAMQARSCLRSIAETEQIDFDCKTKGIIHFYEFKRDFETAEDVTRILRRAGVERHAVTPSEIKEIEPALHGKFYGGFYTPDDFTGDIHKFTSSLARAARRCGVTMRMSTVVDSLRLSGEGVELLSRPVAGGEPGRCEESSLEIFDRIVICAGARSRYLASMVGDRLNVYPVKGYSITVNLQTETDRQAAPQTSFLDDGAKLVTSRLGDDRFRVAGTAEFNGYNKDIVWQRIDPMLKWCRRYFPQMSTENFSSWAGLRPMMPDMMPRYGQGRHPSVFYNTGHGHLGWTLSAATSAVVSELVAGQIDR